MNRNGWNGEKTGLTNLSHSTKILLTGFLILLSLGYLVGWLSYPLKMGFSPEEVTRYYRGAPEGQHYPKEFGQLLDVTHVHSLGLPILFFLVGYLFDMTRIRGRTKGILFALCFTFIFLNLLSVWLVRYVSARFVLLLLASNLVLAATFLAFAFVPLKEMWWDSRK
ncbi:MAG: hypothetical protein ACE5JO_08295 [Candidatus Binatia bacterium]